MLWKLIKDAIKDIEMANDFQLGNESWQRLKRLEIEILEWQHKSESAALSRSIYDCLTDFQKTLLKAAQSKYGTSILNHHSDELREAQELADLDYITIVPAERTRHQMIHIKIKGRQLLKDNDD